GTGAEASIVVGGLPTNVLQHQLKAECQCIGAVRYVPSAARVGSVYPAETPAEWLGITEPLPAWTKKTLEWALAQLQPQAHIEDASLEIYAPDIHRTRRSLAFWIKANEFREP